MTRSHRKRAALFFFLMLALLIAVPVIATWRQVRQEHLNQSLIAAVKRNDDRSVESLLEDGADANCRDEPVRNFSLWQTLMQVVRGRRSKPSHAPTPLLIALLRRRNPDGSGLIYHTPENTPLLRALLDHGANPNPSIYPPMSTLELAIIDGKNATVHLLLAHGATNKQSIDPFPALIMACDRPGIATGVIAELLDHGEDINQRDANGDTALIWSIKSRRVDLAQLLIVRHADTSQRGYDDKTPLTLALQDRSPQGRQIARLLKQFGAMKLKSDYEGTVRRIPAD
jgi:Ankyrin repeats (3 copies)